MSKQLQSQPLPRYVVNTDQKNQLKNKITKQNYPDLESKLHLTFDGEIFDNNSQNNAHPS